MEFESHQRAREVESIQRPHRLDGKGPLGALAGRVRQRQAEPPGCGGREQPCQRVPLGCRDPLIVFGAEQASRPLHQRQP